MSKKQSVSWPLTNLPLLDEHLRDMSIALQYEDFSEGEVESGFQFAHVYLRFSKEVESISKFLDGNEELIKKVEYVMGDYYCDRFVVGRNIAQGDKVKKLKKLIKSIRGVEDLIGIYSFEWDDLHGPSYGTIESRLMKEIREVVSKNMPREKSLNVAGREAGLLLRVIKQAIEDALEDKELKRAGGPQRAIHHEYLVLHLAKLVKKYKDIKISNSESAPFTKFVNNLLCISGETMTCDATREIIRKALPRLKPIKKARS